MAEKFSSDFEIPEGVTFKVEKGIVTISGEKGEVTRNLFHPRINISFKNNKVELCAPKFTQKEKKLLFTYKAHIKNMLNGVKDGVVYKLKVCSSHFPMSVAFNNGVFEVKNFIGERIPRTLSVSNDVKVTIDGDGIVLEGNDKEQVGQVAASIEKLTRRRGFDRRIFQDGIYITEKNGKVMI